MSGVFTDARRSSATSLSISASSFTSLFSACLISASGFSKNGASRKSRTESRSSRKLFNFCSIATLSDTGSTTPSTAFCVSVGSLTCGAIGTLKSNSRLRFLRCRIDCGVWVLYLVVQAIADGVLQHLVLAG